MIIYKSTNQINNKVYIGQTICKLQDRVHNHISDANTGGKMLISKAIRKYGRDSFKWEIIDEAQNQEELDEKEIYWIQHYKSTNRKFGYNISEGGSNGLRSVDFGRYLAKVKGTEEFCVYKTNGEYMGSWQNKRECERDLGLSSFIVGKFNDDGFVAVDGYVFITKSQIPSNHEKFRALFNSIKATLEGCCAYKWDEIYVYCRYTGELVGKYIDYIECAHDLEITTGDVLGFLQRDMSGKWIFKASSNNLKMEFETKPLYYVYESKTDKKIGVYKTAQQVADAIGYTHPNSIFTQLNNTKKRKNKKYIFLSKTRKIVI